MRRALVLASIAALAAPASALAAPSDGHWILDARLRAESVDQDGLPKDALALTLRTRLGYETAAWRGFRALLEGENVAALDDDYNSTVNGKTAYPIVADPATTQLNRAQVAWAGAQGDVVVGRQRLILGNARFIGNSGFRQTEQTFDAAVVRYRPAAKVTLTYAYLDRVHRVFTERSVQGDWRSDSHLFQADAQTPAGALSAYGYLLDFDNAPTQSSQTWGARLAGARPLRAGLSATYEVEYARQSDYRNSPTGFDLDYLDLGAGLKAKPAWASIGYEKLSGDGRRGFQTPLATLHAFQGWADVFLTTPANGVQDFNLRAGATAPFSIAGRPVKLQVAAHDFRAARGSARYGRELDALASAPINPHLTFELKTALFDGAQPAFADRTKVWCSLELKY
ncbi:hypothetical protein [Phenylobacterium soli]|uniref:Alginate export domain-containing protein n=1 Tax=Phenylobacterium soli TaxID=2170551 RepID=A0A328AQG1_9CAUL|nr:hypothetical protein [Phenylobacterium soli]RAK55148.1 hypothetical protein DJ017_11770 [Phenylobacterium soli]